ncbi:ZFYVE19 [Branchiostoma lanceolatum]|uniref:ZFYVE19 protein n=1 Tax=Branchiostoma lanceolatum TaxID=7740 RepID=A0A8J9ZVF1_BRALA|nr:ZFYVE19 [Branchiostoma lanceolatum]
MSGKCYRCATKFGLFKKEVGCPRCGFAFCSKCVSKAVVLPGQQTASSVCIKCHDEVTRRLEKHAAASDRSHTAAATPPLPGGSVQGGFPAGSKDREIAERLQRLKEDRKPARIPTEQEMAARLEALKGTDKPPPSQQDITDRLAILQGKDPAAPQPSSSRTQKRTDVERVDGLLNQIGEEVSLDNRTDGVAQEGEENDLGKEGHSWGLPTSSGLPTNIPAQSDDPENATGIQSTDLEEAARRQEEEVNNLMTQAQAELGAEQAGRQRTQELAHRLDRLKGLDNLTGLLMNLVSSQNPFVINKNKGLFISDWDVIVAASQLSSWFQLVADWEPLVQSWEGHFGWGDGAHSKWDSDEDEAETTRRILQQALEEDKLDEKVKASGFADLLGQNKGKGTKAQDAARSTRQKLVAEDSDSDEELPWCCICNQDATLRCHGCDDDLYCRRCYREGHDRMDIEDHTTSTYKPPGKGR